MALTSFGSRVDLAPILLKPVNQALAAKDYAKAEQEAKKVIEDWSDVPAMKGAVALAKKIVPATKLRDEMEQAFEKEDFKQAEQKANEILRQWGKDAQMVSYAQKATVASVTSAFKQDPEAIPAQAKSFNGHHYFLMNVPMNWNDAKKFCESVGGHLVTITSKEEQEWVKKNYHQNQRNLWLGGYDEKNDGNWKWVTGEPWEYANGGAYLGKDKKGKALFLWERDGTWGGYTEATPWPFIIEWER